MMAKLTRRRAAAAAVALFAMTAVLACSSSEPPSQDFDASLPRRQQDASRVNDTPDAEEKDVADAGDAADAPADGRMDASDGNPCSGRADGVAVAGAANTRCCDGVPVKINSPEHCGSCGIKCPAGQACGNPAPGKWGCRCPGSDQACVTAGYGAGATCYNDGVDSFCNCQCPAGDPSTCTGLCKGGAVCNTVFGQNYCAY